MEICGAFFQVVIDLRTLVLKVFITQRSPITSQLLTLTLSWRRPLSYENQLINLKSKSMHSFLYDTVLHHERVIPKNSNRLWKSNQDFKFACKFVEKCSMCFLPILPFFPFRPPAHTSPYMTLSMTWYEYDIFWNICLLRRFVFIQMTSIYR